MFHQQFVDAFYPKFKRSAQQVFLNGRHERKIAILGREVVHLQVVLAQGGQNAAQDNACIEFVQHLLNNGQVMQVFSLHVA